MARALSARSPCDAGELVPLEDAIIRAASHATPLSSCVEARLLGAIGRTLAKPVRATVALPPFDQSAMDGYAVAAGAGLPSGTALPLAGRTAAGDRMAGLPPGHAMRILTGAPVPAGADAVVMQENATRAGGRVVLTRMARAGDNVRRQGEDVRAGEALLRPGERLDARHVALLASQGLGTVPVRPRPRIAVLATGSELRAQGERLTGSALYDSNRPMILALAAQAGAEVVDGGIAGDDPTLIARALRDLARRSDLVVTTGGVSVGDEDHSPAALGQAGGQGELLRIALKPGKPALVGRIGATAYLGLPGNPVAAMVSWLLLGGAMLAVMAGRPVQIDSGFRLPAAHDFQRRPGRTEFAPARIVPSPTGHLIEIIGRGGSARLRPLAEADGLVRIEPLHAPVRAGDALLFLPFRDGFSI